MIIKFATKRNPNGYRKFLAIDTINNTYATESTHWYCREDFTEIGNKDRQKIIEQLEKENFKRIERL